MYRTPVPPARQDGYDQVPARIQQRADLIGNPKRLYGLLKSVRNMKIRPDYRWLAAELHASVRSVIRWIKLLVAAGLIKVTRHGQGLPNTFEVLEAVTSGRDRSSAPSVTTGHHRPDGPSKKEGRDRNNRNAGRDFSRSDYFETREGRLPGH